MRPTFRSGAAAAKHPMKCRIGGLVLGGGGASPLPKRHCFQEPRRRMEGGGPKRMRTGGKDGDGGMEAQGSRSGVGMGMKEASED